MEDEEVETKEVVEMADVEEDERGWEKIVEIVMKKGGGGGGRLR